MSAAKKEVSLKKEVIQKNKKAHRCNRRRRLSSTVSVAFFLLHQLAKFTNSCNKGCLTILQDLKIVQITISMLLEQPQPMKGPRAHYDKSQCTQGSRATRRARGSLTFVLGLSVHGRPPARHLAGLEQPHRSHEGGPSSAPARDEDLQGRPPTKRQETKAPKKHSPSSKAGPRIGPQGLEPTKARREPPNPD